MESFSPRIPLLRILVSSCGTKRLKIRRGLAFSCVIRDIYQLSVCCSPITCWSATSMHLGISSRPQNLHAPSAGSPFYALVVLEPKKLGPRPALLIIPYSECTCSVGFLSGISGKLQPNLQEFHRLRLDYYLYLRVWSPAVLPVDCQFLFGSLS